MSDLVADLDRAAEAISRSTGRDSHDVAVVLGSGLGSYPATVADTTGVGYGEIPGFPRPQVEGHAGRLHSARLGENRVLLFAGRAHAYEGRGLGPVTFPVRTAIRAGCRTIVVTNAAGGCGDGLSRGDLVLIRDHLNLAGMNPLVGPNVDELGPRFPDMTEAYSAALRGKAHAAAERVGVALRDGVYAWFLGPTYETPAEVEMARRLGADLVGMSTVPEVVAARHMGAEVLGISLVTNLAAGLSETPLSHDEVAEAGAEAASRFGALLDELLPML